MAIGTVNIGHFRSQRDITGIVDKHGTGRIGLRRSEAHRRCHVGIGDGHAVTAARIVDQHRKSISGTRHRCGQLKHQYLVGFHQIISGDRNQHSRIFQFISRLDGDE